MEKTKDLADGKEFYEFKIKVGRELSEMVRFEQFQEMVNKFQRQALGKKMFILDKIENVRKEVSVLDGKIETKLKRKPSKKLIKN